ncbi:metallopeptidase family protein [Jannaschia sp. W003]|uniref:metallopeptidase family protein n=1 Tax=Jannaschia sp. W003 TaxID=2867012 RepID=UPI0021A70303|nr:metallopeptidase family protein [Jannaschia sp. W003]UWQ20635.1 metallopeptidase family protein [Jannaschia sp. W003]
MAPATFSRAPSAERIAALAESARAAFPAPFAALAREVRLEVHEWPAEDVLEELDIEDPYDLTGVYEGVSLTERSADWPDPPSAVLLFRRPILDEWIDRGDVTLAELVSHVTVHEFAHHFGWSDDDIAKIDRWWE